MLYFFGVRQLRETCLVDELILHLHLFAQLAPYFSQSQLVIRMDKPTQPDHVELAAVPSRHVGNDGFNQLQQR